MLSHEEIQRRFTEMSTPQPKKKPAVDPIPKGYTTLTTYLVAQDADALIDFVKKTFDARGTLPQRTRLGRRPALPKCALAIPC